MKFYLQLLLGSLVFFSCNSTTTTQSENELSKVELLAAEVIGIHDEVMPKMETINDLRVKLEKRKEGKLKTAMLEAIDKSLNKLEAADDAMMSWMRAYKMPSKNDERSEEELIKYLESEKKRITEVKNLMLSSIADGENWATGME